MTIQQFKKLDCFQEKDINYNNFINATENTTDLYEYSLLSELLQHLSEELQAGFYADYLGEERGWYQIATEIANYQVNHRFIEATVMSKLLGTYSQLTELYHLCFTFKEETAQHRNKVIKDIKEL